MSTTDIWRVEPGGAVTASLPAPPDLTWPLGARIEVPQTRAIAAYWRMATLVGEDWTVTLEAPDASGAYEFVWRTGGPEPPEFEEFIPLIVEAGVDDDIPAPIVDVDAVRPTVDDVAQLERSRTRSDDAQGSDVGTFDDTTYPTASDVEGLIGRASDDVLAQLPDAVPVDHYGEMRSAIALYTAVLVEGSFFRNADQTSATFWASRFDRAMEQLKARIDLDLRRAKGQVLF